MDNSGELEINKNLYYTNEPKKDGFNLTKISNNNSANKNNESRNHNRSKSFIRENQSKERDSCCDYRSQVNISKESRRSSKRRKSDRSKASKNEYQKDIQYSEISKKSEEEVKYTNEKFKTSRKRLFELLKDKKKFLIGAGISAGLNGAVWPMYGVLLAQAIGTLSQKDIEKVHSGGIVVALYFFTLALCASIVLWMQK